MIATPPNPTPSAPPRPRSARAAGPLLILLAALLVIARWLTRSRYLFDLDSVLYARALDHYDLRLTQPPLPGYYLYILLGRAVRGLFSLGGWDDANLAFVALSALFGLLLAAALYALGTELFGDRRTGLLAAALGLTGPIFWYQSAIASPRIAEGFFAALIVTLGVRLRRRNEAWVFWLLPVTLAVAAGVRQQCLLYLLPFAIWATWRVPLGRRIAGAILLGAGIAAWAVPMLQTSGGLGVYQRMNRELYEFFVVHGTGVFYGSSIGESLQRWTMNVGSLMVYLLFTCVLGLPLLVVAFPRAIRERGAARGLAVPALLFATVPALLFFCFVHVQQIGHFLAVAPFVALVCARLLARLPEPRGRWLIPLVLAANVAFLLFAPPRLIGRRIGTASLSMIRAHDRFARSSIAAARRAGTPENTLLISAPMSYGFIEYYLPGYRYYLMPGLFESGNDAQSGSQQLLTNGFKPLDERWRRGIGRVAAPPEIRRFVTVGWDVEVGTLVDPGANPERPDPDVPALAVVQRAAPTILEFRPGRLAFRP